MKLKNISLILTPLVLIILIILMTIAVFYSSSSKDYRSRAAHPISPTSPFNPTNTPTAGPTNTPTPTTPFTFNPTNTPPAGPTNTPTPTNPINPSDTPTAGPTNTPTPTAPPSVCTIQGITVKMPGNIRIAPEMSQSICNDNASHCSSAQPYSFVTSPGNHTVTFVVPPNFGYTISSSLCYNDIKCHDFAQPTPGAFLPGSSRDIICPAGGFADLWWHLLPNPPTPTGSCPLKPKGDANCDGKITGLDYIVYLHTSCNPEGNQVCSDLRADFDEDKKVNLSDYQIWSDNTR